MMDKKVGGIYMKKVEIVGKNYFGYWNKTRTACRGIIVKNGKLLLSYETRTNQWMIPGGGMEDKEDERLCCIREIKEETGVLVQPSQCMLEITEYYEDWKYVNKYFICKIIGNSTAQLTEREEAVGMEPRWIAIDEIKEIFRQHDRSDHSNVMRRGLYLREYKALCELEGKY